MSDLPTGWEWARLGEVAEVRLGRQRSPKNHSGTHMRPYLRAANVGWDGLKLDDVKEMNFTDEEAGIFRLQIGDIVVSEASGSPGEVGKPALWLGEIDDCCFQNTLLRVRSAGVDHRYLLHLLKAEAIRGSFIDQSRGVGIHHLGSSRLSSWPIPIPPLAEQRRIVATLDDHLSRVSAGSASLEATSSRLAAMTRRLLHDLLASASASQRRLSSLLTNKLINGRSVPSLIGGFPVLRLTALQDSAVNLAERKGGAWTAHDATPFLVQNGDFLISRGNGSVRLVGRGSLVEQDPDPVAFPDTVIRARPDTKQVNPRYLALAWNSPQTRRQIERSARTTAGIYKVNQSLLESISLPIPSLADQQRILNEWHDVSQSTNRLNATVVASRAHGRQLHTSLLREAFAGRLVPQDPNDEPASELLARIRAEREAAIPKQRTRSGRTRKELAAPPTRVTGDGFQQEELPL